MKDFDKFVSKNKATLFSLAEKNTKYDNHGRAVITSNDPWLKEDEWDKEYEELVANERNLSAISVVC
ncbi:MAG: hypothetical protein IJ728_01460 [Selenomonadaceae bacterium]|nr:hypothetical protein [Selenomonadaceae bacterium]